MEQYFSKKFNSFKKFADESDEFVNTTTIKMKKKTNFVK